MPFSILRKMDQDIRESSIIGNKNKNKNGDGDKEGDKYEISENYKYCMKEFNQYQTCTDENPKQDCLDILELWFKCNEKPFTKNK